MQPLPTDGMLFFAKFAEIMSQMTNAESYYGTNLKEPFRELIGLYWRWTKDLMSNKPISGYPLELYKLEFSFYNTICDDIICRFSKLVKYFDKQFFIDTSKYNIAIEEARRKKLEVERDFANGSNPEECVKSMKVIIDEIFRIYFGCKAEKGNLERKAIMKWGGVLGAAFSLLMVIYFQVLSYMKVEPDFFLGVTIPAIIAMVAVMIFFVCTPIFESP